jgi:hypothetical protein
MTCSALTTIKVIGNCGRLLILRSDVDSFLSRKVEYPIAIGGLSANELR